MKRIQFIALFLITATLAIPMDADAQWYVEQQNNEWNEPIDEYLATSGGVEPERGAGYEIGIVVKDCRTTYIMVAGGLPDYAFDVQVEEDGGRIWFRIPVEVDGQKTYWAGRAFKTIRLIELIGKDLLHKLKTARTLRIILDTRQYGSRVYAFDMTGSSNAIRKVCPYEVRSR